MSQQKSSSNNSCSNASSSSFDSKFDNDSLDDDFWHSPPTSPSPGVPGKEEPLREYNVKLNGTGDVGAKQLIRAGKAKSNSSRQDVKMDDSDGYDDHDDSMEKVEGTFEHEEEKESEEEAQEAEEEDLMNSDGYSSPRVVPPLDKGSRDSNNNPITDGEVCAESRHQSELLTEIKGKREGKSKGNSSVKKSDNQLSKSMFSMNGNWSQDDEESKRSDPSTVKSDGRSSRRGHGRKKRPSSSKKKVRLSKQLPSAVEKLKLAQAQLKGQVSNGGQGKVQFQKSDFINLLESSIRDLQAMQSEGDDETTVADDESYLCGTLTTSDKSSARRRSSRNGRHHGSKSGRRKSSQSRSLGSKGSKESSGSHMSRSSRQRQRKRSIGTIESRGWDGVSSRSRPVAGSRSVGGHAPVPREAKKVLSCARGSNALPRETVVSNVVRQLVSKIDRGRMISDDDNVKKESHYCVAIISPSDVGSQNGSGQGKSMVAALTCVRGDIRTRYHRGVAWINMERRSLCSNFEAYSEALSNICRQIGIKPTQLHLSPVVRTPGEDATVSDLRMKGYMKEAHAKMSRLLRSLQRSSSRRRETCEHASVLVVLDDVADALDIEWFQFRLEGENDDSGSKGEQINHLLVTSRLRQIGEDTITVTVPPLETKEALQLLLTESDLPSNHPISNNNRAKTLVKSCLNHPLAIKFAGRWLALKRATSGGQKGIDEILVEVNDAIVEGVEGQADTNQSNSRNGEDTLFSLLNRAMSPLVKGKETKIVRLCFVALITVFYKHSCSTLVPLEIANDFFLKVVENKRDVLLQEDPFFQSNGRQSSKLVPEILGALGIFNITMHTTQVEGSEKENESSIQIDHDLLRYFSRCIHNDESMHHLVKHSESRWHEAYVQSYTHQKAMYLWDDIQPDRSRKYALEKMPSHMIQANMFDDVEMLMQNESFIRGRFWSLGWTEGTKAHVNDAETFCNRLRTSSLENTNDDFSSRLVDACKQLEAVLMEEVARESGGPNGRCSTLEAGRCLHEIVLSLARFRLWDEASRFCDSCVELVESNLGSSELVGSLLYNSSVMHMEANKFDQAEKVNGDCLEMRVKTCGTENILYVRALCQLGHILSLMSDYNAAESCFNKCIGILKVMPARHHLDFGIILYNLGRNKHRRGNNLNEALHCYEEALEFEKDELGLHHVFISSILTHIGDILLEKEDIQRAKHTFMEALKVLGETNSQLDISSSIKMKITIDIVGGKLLAIAGQSGKCIEKFQKALSLFQKYTPTKKRKIAQVCALIGAEHERNGNHNAANKFYEDSVGTMKSVFGPFHLDIAENLICLSRVKSALGGERRNKSLYCEHSAQAIDCLEESIDIRKSRLGDSEETAMTFTVFGAHLTATGDYKKAELAFSNALSILKALEGEPKSSFADALLGIADLMTVISKYDEAMDYYAQCLNIQQSIFGKMHDDIALTLYSMGLARLDEGVYSSALILFAKSLYMRIELHGKSHSAVGDTYDIMGFVEAKSGDLENAQLRLNDALKVRKLLRDRLKEADTLSNIGNLHRERNEFELASKRYDDCLKIRIFELGRNNQSVADVFVALGNVQSDMDNSEEALSHYREGK